MPDDTKPASTAKDAQPEPAPAKDTAGEVRNDRFGWREGDITWVVSPEQAAAKAKKPDGDTENKDEEDDS